MPLPTPATEEATMSRLQNKVAVITGGTSGIGLAAAQRFVAEGSVGILDGAVRKPEGVML